MTELSRRVDVSDISMKNESPEVSNKIESHSNISARPPLISSHETNPVANEEKMTNQIIFYVRLDFAKFDEDYIQVRPLEAVQLLCNVFREREVAFVLLFIIRLKQFG